MFPQKGGRKRNKNKLKLKSLGCFLSLDPGTLNNHILLVASVRWFQIITSKMTCFTKHSFLTKSCSEFEVRATKKPIGFCTISFYAKTWIAGWLILGAPQVDTPIFHGKKPWLWEDPGNDFAPQDVEPFHRVGKCHSLVECPCRREAWRPPESSGRTCLSTSIGATSKNTSKKNTPFEKKQQRHRTVVGCHPSIWTWFAIWKLQHLHLFDEFFATKIIIFPHSQPWCSRYPKRHSLSKTLLLWNPEKNNNLVKIWIYIFSGQKHIGFWQKLPKKNDQLHGPESTSDNSPQVQSRCFRQGKFWMDSKSKKLKW